MAFTKKATTSKKRPQKVVIHKVPMRDFMRRHKNIAINRAEQPVKVTLLVSIELKKIVLMNWSNVSNNEGHWKFYSAFLYTPTMTDIWSECCMVIFIGLIETTTAWEWANENTFRQFWRPSIKSVKFSNKFLALFMDNSEKVNSAFKSDTNLLP